MRMPLIFWDSWRKFPIYHDDYFLALPERAFFVGGGSAFSSDASAAAVEAEEEEGVEVVSSFAGAASTWKVSTRVVNDRGHDHIPELKH